MNLKEVAKKFDIPEEVLKSAAMRRQFDRYQRWLVASDQAHLTGKDKPKFSNMVDYMSLYGLARKADPHGIHRAKNRKDHVKPKPKSDGQGGKGSGA